MSSVSSMENSVLPFDRIVRLIILDEVHVDGVDEVNRSADEDTTLAHSIAVAGEKVGVSVKSSGEIIVADDSIRTKARTAMYRSFFAFGDEVVRAYEGNKPCPWHHA